jgi:hypothetical protein
VQSQTKTYISAQKTAEIPQLPHEARKTSAEPRTDYKSSLRLAAYQPRALFVVMTTSR